MLYRRVAVGQVGSTALYTLGFDVVHELFTVGIHGLKLVEPLYGQIQPLFLMQMS